MSFSTYRVLIYPTAEKDLLEIKSYFKEVLKISPNHLLERIAPKKKLPEQNPYIFYLNFNAMVELIRRVHHSQTEQPHRSRDL